MVGGGTTNVFWSRLRKMNNGNYWQKQNWSLRQLLYNELKEMPGPIKFTGKQFSNASLL